MNKFMAFFFALRHDVRATAAPSLSVRRTSNAGIVLLFFVMAFSKDITEILNALLSGVRESLGHNLLGVYLRGSLATGDFNADTSDVDVLAVTLNPVSEAEFDALVSLHARLAALPNPYAYRIEMAYIDRAALKQYRAGVSHPTLGQGRGENLVWSEHHSNWLLERWTVRECGVTLHGPSPRSLIDPIPRGEILEAVRSRLCDWAEWARNPDDPEWLAPRRAAAAYVVETMCRALYTLARAELSSKAKAVAWAIDSLPEPWRSTAERSRGWRTDDTTDPDIVPEVTGFVFWAAARAAAAARQVVTHGSE